MNPLNYIGQKLAEAALRDIVPDFPYVEVAERIGQGQPPEDIRAFVIGHLCERGHDRDLAELGAESLLEVFQKEVATDPGILKRLAASRFLEQIPVNTIVGMLVDERPDEEVISVITRELIGKGHAPAHAAEIAPELLAGIKAEMEEQEEDDEDEDSEEPGIIGKVLRFLWA